MDYIVIKIFNKETDELVEVALTTKETFKDKIKSIDHEKLAYFCIKCNLNKMLRIVSKYKRA